MNDTLTVKVAPTKPNGKAAKKQAEGPSLAEIFATFREYRYAERRVEDAKTELKEAKQMLNETQARLFALLSDPITED